MSLIDFLKEERQERKKQKQLQKEQKKGKKTPEQKRMRVYAIITVILITFGVIFYSCRNTGGYSWNEIIGITDEMIVELEKEVDEEELFPQGQITELDWLTCNEILKDAGLDLEGDTESDTITKNFTLTDKQVASLAKKLLKTIDTSSVVKNIYYLEIYVIGEAVYQKSVVSVDLSSFTMSENLPSVYVTNISKVEVLNNSLTCLSNDVKINNIDNELNDELLQVLGRNSTSNITTIANELINTTITVFAQTLHLEMSLAHGQIHFSI